MKFLLEFLCECICCRCTWEGKWFVQPQSGCETLCFWPRAKVGNVPYEVSRRQTWWHRNIIWPKCVKFTLGNHPIEQVLVSWPPSWPRFYLHLAEPKERDFLGDTIASVVFASNPPPLVLQQGHFPMWNLFVSTWEEMSAMGSLKNANLCLIFRDSEEHAVYRSQEAVRKLCGARGRWVSHAGLAPICSFTFSLICPSSCLPWRGCLETAPDSGVSLKVVCAAQTLALLLSASSRAENNTGKTVKHLFTANVSWNIDKATR